MKSVRRESEFLADAGVTVADIAAGAGVAVDVVRAWLDEGVEPQPCERDAVLALAVITRRMRTVVIAAEVPRWLRRKVPALDGRTPLEAIADGDGRAVEQIVGFLESPGAIWARIGSGASTQARRQRVGAFGCRSPYRTP